MEVEVIKSMWYEGKPVEPGVDGKPNPVIALPVSEAIYLESIGRVRRIESKKKGKAK